MGERSVVLDVGARGAFHAVLLFGVYLLVTGHNRPGGGFASGLVAGAAFVLLTIASGVPTMRARLRVAPETLLAAGLLLASGTAIAGLLAGRQFLESGRIVLELPIFGTVKVYSVLAFDSGVFLVVVGLVTLLLERLGADDIDYREEVEHSAEPHSRGPTGAAVGTGAADEEHA